MNKKILALATMLLLVIGCLPLLAQATTAGSLTGIVTDASGAALPGVSVELAPYLTRVRSHLSVAKILLATFIIVTIQCSVVFSYKEA